MTNNAPQGAFLIPSVHETIINANHGWMPNMKRRSLNSKGSHSHKAGGDYGHNTHISLSLHARNCVSLVANALHEIPDVAIHLLV